MTTSLDRTLKDVSVLSDLAGFYEMANILQLSEEEVSERETALKESFMPFKVTEYYARLIAGQPQRYKTQMLNIVSPPPYDKKPFQGRFDPYGNKSYRQDDRAFLQHKYDPTLLLHIDNFCISNCQFCYKVNEIRHETVKSASVDEKVDMALDYLSFNPEVNNVLFTGGDPAAFRRTEDLVNLIGRLIAHPNIRVVRFATKGLAYDPERFLDPKLLKFFNDVNKRPGKQVSIIAQINHPGEMSPLSCEALAALSSVGVQVRGQPALIRGVNDDPETLVDLQRKYLDNQIISYYLTVFMPVRGVEQYALPLDQAFAKVTIAKRKLSGLEKKGVLLSSHDFGKFEVCGFYPSSDKPDKIVLKWHQAARSKYLPQKLKDRVGTQPEDLLILNYLKDEMYCIDHVFKFNDLPFYDSDGNLQE